MHRDTFSSVTYLSQTTTLVPLFLVYACNTRSHETGGMEFRLYKKVAEKYFIVNDIYTMIDKYI